ncbi:hypothetical protein N7536_007217 [Penicillium majusculum]|nr:hypothetical protein N7536_007217 [Penicillium majusculum]
MFWVLGLECVDEMTVYGHSMHERWSRGNHRPHGRDVSVRYRSFFNETESWCLVDQAFIN